MINSGSLVRLGGAKDATGCLSCRRVAGDIYESAFAEAAEPCALSLGESSSAGFDAGNHFVVIIFAGETCERFAITDGLPGGTAEFVAASEEVANFVDETTFD